MAVAKPGPEKQTFLRTADGFLRESLAANPLQQRANYNLGTLIFDEKDKAKLGLARQYLEKAAEIKNWEKAPNEEFACHIYYNLACAYSRLTEHEQDAAGKKTLLDLAAKALDRAAKKGGTERKVLEGDLSGGDLAALADSAAHAAQLTAIQERFRLAWARRGRG
jgi:ATP-dependent exoDNAse (exonuclease V) beta subunit